MTSVPTVTLNNGRTIPQLGLGVFQVEPGETKAVVAEALKVGYRHIDTAQLYGNEAEVGEAIAESGIDRGELFITTKLGNDDQGYDSALHSFDGSLKRLGLDYVDLFLIHWPKPSQDLYVDSWKAFEKLYADGLARSIGVSNFQPNHLHRLQSEATIVPAVNQVELHPTFTQSDLRAVHAQLGIATESWAPLGQAADLGSATVTTIAERLGKSPAQVVIRWHLQHGLIVFPKSVNPGRIAANFDVFDFELTDEDLSAISALDAGNRMGPNPDSF